MIETASGKGDVQDLERRNGNDKRAARAHKEDPCLALYININAPERVTMEE